MSACHAYYQSGFKQDIPAIVKMAREVGALTYVDAYQSLGTEPLDVKALDVDFLASGRAEVPHGDPRHRLPLREARRGRIAGALGDGVVRPGEPLLLRPPGT